MEVKVYNQKGKESGTVKLPKSVFGVTWNADLVHQVIISMMSNARTPVAHTKDRGDVRGGGKKPWKQKGTGRARHGSIRSPIWVGGGVTFGPLKFRNFTKKINKKMRIKALFAILSRKLSDNQILFVDAMKFDAPKTKEAKSVMESFAKIKGFDVLNKKYNVALIAVPEKDEALYKSFNNFSNMKVKLIKDINPVDVLKYKTLIIVNPEVGLKALENRLK